MNTGPECPQIDSDRDTICSFLEGVSPIDFSRLSLQSRDEASQFLTQYGYDMAIPSEHHEAWNIFYEAFDYMERVLCPAPTPADNAVVLPQQLSDIKDLTEILLTASGDNALQPWACALLRVMHTISHANHAIRSPFFHQIQNQILERYRRHIYQQENQQLTLGSGPQAIPLEDMQLREEKNRDSLILKLLHKPNNVAQSVYDRIGVKLVTPTKFDALNVLKYIRKHHLAIFANVMPGRSRNTLIDLETLCHSHHALPATLTSKDLLDGDDEQTRSINPHSSPAFRSIQFTCRQLIRVPNPQYTALQELKASLKQRIPAEELNQLLSQLNAENPEPVLRFFFPYEVQILDHDNHLRTIEGESSHANYRLRQLRTARQRVLGQLLKSP